MKISNKIYKKMVEINKLQKKCTILETEINKYLVEKGINIELIREDDIDGYVDMISYGRGIMSKEELEKLFDEFKIEVLSN